MGYYHIASKSTSQWLEHNLIDIFLHPASSPDLSPIKPLCKMLNRLIQAHSYLLLSTRSVEYAKEAWDQITVEDIKAHVWHMED